MFNEKEIVENLLKRNDLTDWDKDFMLSISERFNSGKDLTEKQIEWVHKIASRYSEEAVKERQDWASQWNSDISLKEKAKICAEYYLETGYYTWSKKLLLDEEFVPSLKQFKSLTDNKYAAKVLAAYNTEAKYPVGTMVQIRKTLKGPDARLIRRKMYQLETELALVVSTSEKVVSACNGNKRYKIILVGDASPLFAEERDLKKLSKKVS